MALKDWKKVGALRWRKNKEVVQVYKGNWPSQNKEYYIVAFGELIQYGTTFGKRKFFKTKAQALLFVKQYMRTH